MSAAITVVGSLNMDFVVQVETLPLPGETVTFVRTGGPRTVSTPPTTRLAFTNTTPDRSTWIFARYSAPFVWRRPTR